MKTKFLSEIKEGFIEIKDLLLKRELYKSQLKGVTPFSVVYSYKYSKLLHYSSLFSHNLKNKPIATSILIPPFMVQPFIYDIRPHRSFVRTLLYYNIETYIIDLGVPIHPPSGFHLKDYVVDILPVMIREVKQRNRYRTPLFLIGYCMGGILILLYLSLFRDREIKGIVTVATPLDFSKLGMLYLLGWLLRNQVIDFVNIAGVIPGAFASTGFKLLTFYKLISKILNTILDPEDFKSKEGYEVTNEWLNSMIPYPGETFKDFFLELFLYNKLSEKDLYIDGRNIDLSTVELPVFSIAGENDNIAPLESIEQIMSLLSQKAEKSIIITPGGHISVLIGDFAKEKVWKKIVDWIILHAGNL